MIAFVISIESPSCYNAYASTPARPLNRLPAAHRNKTKAE